MFIRVADASAAPVPVTASVPGLRQAGFGPTDHLGLLGSLHNGARRPGALTEATVVWQVNRRHEVVEGLRGRVTSDP